MRREGGREERGRAFTVAARGRYLLGSTIKEMGLRRGQRINHFPAMYTHAHTHAHTYTHMHNKRQRIHLPAMCTHTHTNTCTHI